MVESRSQCEQPVALPQGDRRLLLPLAYPCHLCSWRSPGGCCALLFRLDIPPSVPQKLALRLVAESPNLFAYVDQLYRQPSATHMHQTSVKGVQTGSMLPQVLYHAQSADSSLEMSHSSQTCPLYHSLALFARCFTILKLLLLKQMLLV